MRPDLVIFDCDGVLVDSEPISVAVLIDTVAKAGIKLAPETVYDRFLGKSMTSICETLSEEFAVDLAEAHLADLRRELFARFRRELRPVFGVAEVLENLGIERCVASSSQPDRIRLSLEITGLLGGAGPDIFSAAMVERGKPAPDLFLYAAEQMAVDPSRCVVIEDSPPGIRAAKAAGMKVFAFQGASHGGLPRLQAAIAELSPDETFDDMAKLPELLRHAMPAPKRRRSLKGPLIFAVDVGTASARAGIFDTNGTMLGRSAHSIEINRRGSDQAEHNSENIWLQVCAAVQTATTELGVDPTLIKAIGFDATCSLVVRGRGGQQLPVSLDGDPQWDTLAWHDHRAINEADDCTLTGADLLDFVGSTVSPELQIPKLMWLKKNVPDTWAKSAAIFDLADFLTWKSTGSTARSQGPLSSKWMFMAHDHEPWRGDFFAKIGLEDWRERAALPATAVPTGKAIGRISSFAAAQLGLSEGCIVASGLIDAHAGTLGLIGAMAGRPQELERNLALVAGTSNCVATLSTTPRRFAGVWGPYFGAALNGWWLSEAGQSATGALLDHMIRLHGAGGEPSEAMHRRIVARVRELRAMEGSDLAARLHILPDFHGNRSPGSNPRARGSVSGLNLDASFDGLCRLYWRTCVGIALGVRHMVEKIVDNDHQYDAIFMAGGHTRNPLLLEIYRDSVGLPLATLPGTDAVLLGTAMNAAAAAKLHPSIEIAAQLMCQPSKLHQPDPKSKSRVARDYAIFLEMIEQRTVLEKMQSV